MKGVNMCLSFGTEHIYENANFEFHDFDKVGIVGVNGAGKTTLFKILLNQQPLEEGKIIIPKGKRLGYLPQEIVLLDQEEVVFDYLLSARPIKKLEIELTNLYEKVAIARDKEQTSLLKEIGKVQELLEYYDCYQAENQLLELLDQMKIAPELWDKKLRDLSGGQKSKIAFAHLLYGRPEILLLDEPTNHLDATTRSYITNYLKQYQGMVLIISHDTVFLDEIVDRVLKVDKVSKQMKVYQGNYTTYLKKEAAEAAIKEKLIQKQEKEIESLRDIVLLYSNSSGKRKRMAQSREKTLAKKMSEKVDRDQTYKKVKLNLKPNQEGSRIPLKVNGISFHYDQQKQLMNQLSFLVNSKERFLIVGENGVGKSTLLKLLVGLLKPDEGTIWYGNKTDLAYYAQEQEQLNLNETILENVQAPIYSEKELRTVLGCFLFYGDDVFKKVSVLSPGEKARISLCKVMLEKANLLLLDEPTNHLDPLTQQLIGENFHDYEGTIIMVSHNPSFVESVGIDRMLILPSGKITNYSKEKLEYYQEKNQRSSE